MNTRTPSLRQLADGRWFTKWGGRCHFFGRDPVLTAERYTESLKAWQAWRLRVKRAQASIPHAQRRPLVIDVADEVVTAHIDAEFIGEVWREGAFSGLLIETDKAEDAGPLFIDDVWIVEHL